MLKDIDIRKEIWKNEQKNGIYDQFTNMINDRPTKIDKNKLEDRITRLKNFYKSHIEKINNIQTYFNTVKKLSSLSINLKNEENIKSILPDDVSKVFLNLKNSLKDTDIQNVLKKWGSDEQEININTEPKVAVGCSECYFGKLLNFWIFIEFLDKCLIDIKSNSTNYLKRASSYDIEKDKEKYSIKGKVGSMFKKEPSIRRYKNKSKKKSPKFRRKSIKRPIKSRKNIY